MIMALTRIDDVNRLVATLKTVLNEWEQDAVLLLIAVEKCTYVAHLAEL